MKSLLQHVKSPDQRAAEIGELTDVERSLLNDYQHGFPKVSRPFQYIADNLGIDEASVLECYTRLIEQGYISRIGPVFKPKRIGESTLAAIAVPNGQLQQTADLVSTYKEVNHNYEREHEFNLWFVINASDRQRIDDIISEIRDRTNLQVLDLPMLKAWHIDLGFSLWC